MRNGDGETVMGKKKLIPLEKSKKVIYVEKRGCRRPQVSVGAVCFAVAGALCILYCIGIALAGAGTWFFLIWGLIGVLSLLTAYLLTKRELLQKLPRWFRTTAIAMFVLGFVLFAAVEGMIFSQFGADAAPGADYVIVLGAQWKAEGPSEVLRRRLNRAAAYLKENPAAAVIVSGGQGSNEPISEAAGMRAYLMEAGIAQGRILTEEASESTVENLMFSGRLLDKKHDTVVIVTNNFHMFRALGIAKKQGYAHVEGLAADSSPGFLPHNLLREFLGVLKDFLLGNLHMP